MHIEIQKIVLHKARINSDEEKDQKNDVVFIFTPHRLDQDNLLSFQIYFRPETNDAKNFIERELKTTTYDLVYEGQEVIAPE